MKKYRLVKIKIKTREIISVPESTAHAAHASVCPVCHSPLAVALPEAENNPAKMLTTGAADEKNNK